MFDEIMVIGIRGVKMIVYHMKILGGGGGGQNDCLSHENTWWGGGGQNDCLSNENTW